jgi:DHA1 family tetracycline resistance protein-like MFS transporter
MTPVRLIVLIVLMDLLGFSIVMPLLAPFAEHYGFTEWQIGVLFSAYPVCQLVAGPILGRLSDRHGRRRLLILSQAGTALSFLILGLTRSFLIMLLARMIDGASGGNILVAQAYVADMTPPQDRTRGMGLIGMAFGLGFVLGPALGGALLSLPIGEDWRLRLPFLVAASFSTVAWLLVFFQLPESLPGVSKPRESARVLSRRGLTDLATIPGVGHLVALGFLAVLAFAAFEGTFALYLRRRLGYDARTAAFAFAGLGLLTAFVQGGLIRRLVTRVGERRLIVAGLFLAASGFAGVALASGAGPLALALALLGCGQGVVGPCVAGLLSRITPLGDQGAVFGVLASAQTLARMISYSVANILLGLFSTGAPYWSALGVDVVALALALAEPALGGPRQVSAPASIESAPAPDQSTMATRGTSD